MSQEQISLPPVAVVLDALQIPYSIFTHATVVNSLEQAAAERGQSPDQVVRSILFRLGNDRYAMVLMAGAAQVSWKMLRQFFAQSRLTMATEEEVQRITGYPIGGVSPFALPQSIPSMPLPILLDEAITKQEEISIGSGVRGTTIILRAADLVNALPDAQIGNFKV